jgi:glycosyltransferase involved in cell wall biosynthesis
MVVNHRTVVTGEAAEERNLGNNQPLVSVIIPVYNDADRLALCLMALDGQTYPRHLLEIVVVDNGSEDDVVEIAERFEGVRLLREPRPGSYAARNRGIVEAKGDIIAFTDADCRPTSTWIERAVRHLVDNPGIGVVGGRIEVVAMDPNNPSGVELYEIMTGFPQQRYIEEFRFAATASMFTRMSVFDLVGLFNEELMSGGDREWGMRVHASGFRLRYADDVITVHPARNTLRQLYMKSKRRHAGVRDASSMRKSSRASGKKLLRNLVPPVRTGWRMLQDDRVPTIWAWVRLVAVLTLVRLLSVWFTLRFAVGGRSPRR